MCVRTVDGDGREEGVEGGGAVGCGGWWLQGWSRGWAGLAGLGWDVKHPGGENRTPGCSALRGAWCGRSIYAWVLEWDGSRAPCEKDTAEGGRTGGGGLSRSQGMCRVLHAASSQQPFRVQLPFRDQRVYLVPCCGSFALAGGQAAAVQNMTS